MMAAPSSSSSTRQRIDQATRRAIIPSVLQPPLLQTYYTRARHGVIVVPLAMI